MQKIFREWICANVFGQMPTDEHRLALHRLKYDPAAAGAYIRENIFSWGYRASGELKCAIFFYWFKDDVPELIAHLQALYARELDELLELQAP